MGHRQIILVVTGALLAIGYVGCSPGLEEMPAEPGAASDGPVSVYTVNYPLRYFAERIGGEHVAVTFPAPADGDPAFWVPDAEAVAAYQGADLILLNGAGYAKWADKVSLPKAKLANTSDAFRDQYIAIKGAATHTHGPGGDHAHDETAFTTWLDAKLAVKQADAIRAALTELRPEQEQTFAENFAALKDDLEELDRRMAEIVAEAPDQSVVFSHPVYQYATWAHGLNGRSVHWEPGELPSEAMWGELKTLLAEHPAAWMIWEGPPLPETVAATFVPLRAVHEVVFEGRKQLLRIPRGTQHPLTPRAVFDLDSGSICNRFVQHRCIIHARAATIC